MCTAAVQYLMYQQSASQETAENAVIHAYGELRHSCSTQYADLSLSTGSVIAIRDANSGMVYAVPVGLIYQRIVAASKRATLRLVTTDLH